MELDHIFIFIQEPEQVASALQEFGLAEGTPNVHPGQGTACRRFFFQNAYLELVWVINDEEIKSPGLTNTKLWERSAYHLTQYCPFGLCFRAKQNTNDAASILFDDGWRYYSPFLPQGQFANIAPNHQYPAEPMLFEMPFFGKAPKDYPIEKQQPLNHINGFKEITKVKLTLPTPAGNLSKPMQKVMQESIVSLIEGEIFFVSLEFDGGNKGAMQNFYPLLPLSIRW